MRGPGREQLLFAIYEIRRIECRQLESVAVRDGVGGAGLNAISAKNAAVVINVIDLGVAFCTAHAVFGGILGGLNVNAIRRAIGRAQKAGHALFQAIFIALKHVHAAETLLKLRAAQRSGAVGIVLDDRRLEHLFKRDAHAFGDGGDVFDDGHTKLV